MINLKKFFYLSASALCLASCSNGTTSEPTPDPKPVESSKLEIKISPSLSNVRVSDYGFDQNDRIGLFVVNYNEGNPASLLTTGNHVDNMGFTYTGKWTPDTPIYWKDESTHADMYLYFPYSDIKSVNAHSFSVKADQSAEENYKASEFIYGKVVNVAPTSEATSIGARHLMSRISITLEAGNGFTKESLATSDITVKINGLKTSSKINLADATVTPAGETASITPWHNNDAYIALIVPQTVEEGNLITVNVDGRDFNLKKAFSFESGKNHSFKVILRKTSNGINVDITPWEDDETDNGGYAE